MKFKGNAGEYEKPATGVFGAICYKIVDLGTQEVDWKGSKKKQQKVIISWELDQKMKDGRPFAISKKYTRSLAETSRLRKDLESWRGKVFTQEEIDTFDETKILGKPCLLTLVASEDGKYVNISAVTGLPKSMPPPQQVNPSIVLSLEPGEFNQEVFDSLGDKTKAMITLSPEWHTLKGLPVEAHAEAASGEEEEVPF